MSDSMSNQKGSHLTYLLSAAEVRSGARTLTDVFRGWSVTSRLEFLPDVPVHIILPLFLVLRRQPWDFSLLRLSLIGLLVWLMAYWVGSSLNCLADYAVDKLDTGHKARLAAAVDAAGIKTLLLVNGVEALAASALTVYLSLEMQKPLLLLFWILGLILAIFYSFEPLRLKRRNLLNPLSLDAIVYLLPFLYVYYLLSDEWNLFELTIIVLYCLQMLSMFLADEVSDHDEDAAMGVKNPCVRYGRVWASRLAMMIYAFAAVTLLLLLHFHEPEWFNGKLTAMTLSVIIYAWVILEFHTLYCLSRCIEASRDAEGKRQFALRIKKFSKIPMWLMTTSIGIMLLVATFSRLWL